MKQLLLLCGSLCFSPVLAQPVDLPFQTTAGDREGLPMSSVQSVMQLRVSAADVDVYDFEVHILLDGNAIMHSSGKPDVNGLISQYLPREYLDRIPDPHSYVLMGYSGSERYYTLELRGVRLWQVIATLATGRVTATRVRPNTLYEYESGAAADIAVELVGERLSAQEVYQAISTQTGCEVNELASGTLSVSGCP